MSSIEHIGEGSVLPPDPNDLKPDYLHFRHGEVGRVAENLWLPEAFFSQRLPEDGARELLNEGGFSLWEDLELPTTRRGHLDFRRLHIPYINELTNRYEEIYPGLSEDFQHRYITYRGATDGIKGLIGGWAHSGKMTRLGVLQDEYKGYANEAAGLIGEENIDIIPSLEDTSSPVEGRVVFISNPSAIDGNWHDPEKLTRYIEAGNKVVIDGVYGDSSLIRNGLKDMSSENIMAFVTSPNKQNGTVLRRPAPGLVYTKELVRASASSTPFPDRENILIALELSRRFPPGMIARLTQPMQQQIVESIREDAARRADSSDAAEAIEVNRSDVVLVANAENLPDAYAKTRRELGGHTLRLSIVLEQLRDTTQ